MPDRSIRSHPLAWLAVAGGAVALGGLAGCGGSAKEQASNSPASVAPSTVTTPSTSPADTSPATIEPSKDLPKHTSPDDPDVPSGAVPEAPKPIHVKLKPATAADKIKVQSPGDSDPKWRVSAQLQGKNTFCLVVTSVGVVSPAPDCQSGTQLAVSFFSNLADGEADANVAQIARSPRSKPSDVLVSGVAAGSVKKVVIDYRHHKYTARMSSKFVSMPVDRAQAHQITQQSVAKLKKVLPSPLTLRVFGFSIPEVNGNPPTAATVKSKHPVHGVMTFVLQ